MQTSKSSLFIKKVKNTLSTQSHRLVDQHINLAVTGLSGSGKTAFITSLINLLLNAREESNLPFLSVSQEGRLLGVLTQPQKDMAVSSFDYSSAINNLSASPPQWPESTRSISQVRLKFRFERAGGFKHLISQYGTLTLDITDYPGEWLMDMPMLEQTYEQWSEKSWSLIQSPDRRELAEPFIAFLELLTKSHIQTDEQIAQCASLYQEYLTHCKENGFSFIQPGRFIMPGELRNAPVLAFFPLPSEVLCRSQLKDLTTKLESRFEFYKKKVVQPFYQNHFRHFDRQIILVDLMSALNRGEHHLKELEQSLSQVLKNFHYGKQNKLLKLISPKIEKLAFAVTKADHASIDQQENLKQLLNNVLTNAKSEMYYSGANIQDFVISSIRSSISGVVEHEGKQVYVVKGKTNEGKKTVLFPGEVPNSVPASSFWQHHHFEFPSFAPRQLAPQKVVQHIRMDQILEYLIGDKLK